jgi:hypothetical protein
MILQEPLEEWQISSDQLERWSEMSPNEVIADRDYLVQLTSIDVERLKRSQATFEQVYERYLPRFQQELKDNYNIQQAPMFSETLGRWVLSVLEMPQFMVQILDLHGRVPPQVIRETLNMLIMMAGDVPEDGEEWQRAIYILSLPLMLER